MLNFHNFRTLGSLNPILRQTQVAFVLDTSAKHENRSISVLSWSVRKGPEQENLDALHVERYQTEKLLSLRARRVQMDMEHKNTPTRVFFVPCMCRKAPNIKGYFFVLDVYGFLLIIVSISNNEKNRAIFKGGGDDGLMLMFFCTIPLPALTFTSTVPASIWSLGRLADLSLLTKLLPPSCL